MSSNFDKIKDGLKSAYEKGKDETNKLINEAHNGYLKYFPEDKRKVINNLIGNGQKTINDIYNGVTGKEQNEKLVKHLKDQQKLNTYFAAEINDMYKTIEELKEKIRTLKGEK